MMYKRSPQRLTSPSAYRPAGTVLLLQYKVIPQQNKVRVSMPMGLSFFQFSMLIALLSSVIIFIVCKVSFLHNLLSTKPLRDTSIM